MPEIISKDSHLYSRYLIGKARHIMFQARQKELRPQHISPRQANTLIIVYKLGGKATLAELAKNTDRGINTLSIQMTRMEKDGLVRKVRKTPKTNQLRFELTEKGFDTYNKIKKITSVKTIMSVLSEEQLRLLISMLETIIAKAEKYTPY